MLATERKASTRSPPATDYVACSAPLSMFPSYQVLQYEGKYDVCTSYITAPDVFLISTRPALVRLNYAGSYLGRQNELTFVAAIVDVVQKVRPLFL